VEIFSTRKGLSTIIDDDTDPRAAEFLRSLRDDPDPTRREAARIAFADSGLDWRRRAAVGRCQGAARDGSPSSPAPAAESDRPSPAGWWPRAPTWRPSDGTQRIATPS